MARDRKKETFEWLFKIWFGEVRNAITNILVNNPNYGQGFKPGYYHRKGPAGVDELISSVKTAGEHFNFMLDSLEKSTLQFVHEDLEPPFRAVTEYAEVFGITEERANLLMDSIENTLQKIPVDQYSNAMFVQVILARMDRSSKNKLAQNERDYVMFITGALLARARTPHEERNPVT